ncbi:BadF/BadG/BcrA/BcrD ATPase family protein [Kitasatospora sp. NPDC050543]|uniref:BadF/BadG/BcrA/BcrD ATPase family protein n=1 Tax=Kitasatospora sp. NPDC050543 TaxID=3364054 RepID=UPI0037ACE787
MTAEQLDAQPAHAGDWVLGVDIGGTGVRLAAARLTADGPAGRPATTGAPAPRPAAAWPAIAAELELRSPARTGADGIDAGALLDPLLPAVRALLGQVGTAAVHSVAVGASGMALLGRDLAARLPDPLTEACGARRLILASDAVAAYAGALGARPGVVVAAGTGMVALGTDLATGWHRADGWGHLLGDCGGGAWIGRAALDAALRAHDGRAGGSAALLDLAVRRLGPVTGLPAAVQRSDRAGLLASLAPDVAAAAEAGERVALDILARAAREIAATAIAAAARIEGPRYVALTGRLFEFGPLLRGPVEQHLGAGLDDARLVPAEGPPLLGAVRLAAAAAVGDLPWPAEAPLLRVIQRP